jgi:CheY-like chemotaxis protein
MQNAPPSVPFDQFVIYHNMVRDENKEFKDFIDKQTEKFETFIYTIIAAAVAVIGGILVFFGWRTASNIRDQTDNMIRRRLDETEKQIDASIKVAADAQIATKTAELHKRIDKMFAEVEEALRQRKMHVDRWLIQLSSLLNPPEERFNFEQLMPGKRVLWVDDHPDDNKDMVGLLTTIGQASVDISDSTDDAIYRISHSAPYNLIISDMRRGNDAEAGIKFLEDLKKRNIRVPEIISTGANNLRKLGAKAVTEGAYAVVGSDPGLLRAMTSCIRGQRPTGVEGAAATNTEGPG